MAFSGLYLCGKDTGLEPLFDVSGAHIDCISGADCTENYGRGRDTDNACVQYKNVPTGSTGKSQYQRLLQPIRDYARLQSTTGILSDKKAGRADERGKGDSGNKAAAKKPTVTKAGLFGLSTPVLIGAAVAIVGVGALAFLAKKAD